MKYTTIIKFFLIAGSLFVLAGIYQYERTKDFVDHAAEAIGNVVRLDRSDGQTYKPVVEWTDHTGVRRTLYSNTGTSPPRFFEGEQVTILFDPADPKYPVNARIHSTLQLWGVAIFLIAFGSAWILIASLTGYVLSKGGVIYFDGSQPDVAPD